MPAAGTIFGAVSSKKEISIAPGVRRLLDDGERFVPLHEFFFLKKEISARLNTKKNNQR